MAQLIIPSVVTDLGDGGLPTTNQTRKWGVETGTGTNKGLTINTGGSLEMRGDTVFATRIISHSGTAVDHTILDMEDSTLYITGTGGGGGELPAGWGLFTNLNVFGTIRGRDSRMYFTASNGGYQFQNAAGSGANNDSLILDLENFIFEKAPGFTDTNSASINLFGIDAANSNLTNVTFGDGVSILLANGWKSTGTSFGNTITGSEICRFAERGGATSPADAAANFMVLHQPDFSTTAADSFGRLHYAVSIFLTNPLVSSTGLIMNALDWNQGANYDGVARNLYVGFGLAAQFQDPATGSVASDLRIALEDNRHIVRPAIFDTLNAFPAINAVMPAFNAGGVDDPGDNFYHYISGTDPTIDATTLESGIVLLRPAFDNSENNTTESTAMGTVVRQTTAPTFKAWSYSHQVPFINNLATTAVTASSGEALNQYGTLFDNNPDNFATTDIYTDGVTEDRLVQEYLSADGTVIKAASDGSEFPVGNNTARRTNTAPADIVDLYRAMKITHYRSKYNTPFTDIVTVTGTTMNWLSSEALSLNAGTAALTWHDGSPNRFAIGRNVAANALTPVPGIIDEINILGDIILPNNLTTTNGSVLAGGQIQNLAANVASTDGSRLILSVGATERLRNINSTDANIWTAVDFVRGYYDGMADDSIFTNVNTSEGTRIGSETGVGTFTIDGGTIVSDIRGIRSGAHTWTFKGDPVLTIDRNSADQTEEEWIATSTPADPHTADNFVASDSNQLRASLANLGTISGLMTVRCEDANGNIDTTLRATIKTWLEAENITIGSEARTDAATPPTGTQWWLVNEAEEPAEPRTFGIAEVDADGIATATGHFYSKTLGSAGLGTYTRVVSGTTNVASLIDTDTDDSLTYAVWWKRDSEVGSIYDWSYTTWAPGTQASATIASFQPDPSSAVTGSATEIDYTATFDTDAALATFLDDGGTTHHNVAVFRLTSANNTFNLSAGLGQTTAWKMANEKLYMDAVVTANLNAEAASRLINFAQSSVGPVTTFANDLLAIISDVGARQVNGWSGFITDEKGTGANAFASVTGTATNVIFGSDAQISALAAGVDENRMIDIAGQIANSVIDSVTDNTVPGKGILGKTDVTIS